jgi:glycosyltransferase involved in cell wall biosynthesis
MSSPIISLVMPVHNGAAFLEDAIRSVLLQSFQDFELIIVDDNSADQTASILETFARMDRRIKILKNVDVPGDANARNVGIAQATGNYIAVHDADDISRPERLQRQLTVMHQRSTLAILGSFLEMITVTGDTIKVHYEPVGPAFIRFHLQVGMPFGHPSVMMRTAYLKRMPKAYLYNNFGDYDLFARMILAGARADNLPEPLVRYRIHPKQLSAVEAHEQAKAADEISRSCLAQLTGQPVLEPHCIATFRQVVHSMLTGNPVACEVTSQIINDIAALIGHCRRHGSLSWFEARGLKKRLEAFATNAPIHLMRDRQVAAAK